MYVIYYTLRIYKSLIQIHCFMPSLDATFVSFRKEYKVWYKRNKYIKIKIKLTMKETILLRLYVRSLLTNLNFVTNFSIHF